MTSRVVVVTGSAGSIGTEIARAFEQLGDVVEGLDVVDGFDVTDPGACAAAVTDIIDRRGRIDVLCNNAGIGATGDAVAATRQDWERVFAVNVYGAAYMTAAVLPGMRAAHHGVIVNTGSVVATRGFADRVVYSASKGALLSMTRAVARDELVNGVRVVCVSPATVDGSWLRHNAAATEDPPQFMATMRQRQPTGELIPAAAVARAVVYLASHDVHVSGIDLPVDDGLTSLAAT